MDFGTLVLMISTVEGIIRAATAIIGSNGDMNGTYGEQTPSVERVFSLSWEPNFGRLPSPSVNDRRFPTSGVLIAHERNLHTVPHAAHAVFWLTPFVMTATKMSGSFLESFTLYLAPYE